MGGESAQRRVDVEEIMALVRARARGEADRGAAQAPAESGRRGDPELRRLIAQARPPSNGALPEERLGWKTPIVGRAWMVVRRWIHQEVRIYADALGKQQSAFDASVLRALGRIAELLEDRASQEEVAALRAEVEALRAEVRALRERLGADAR